MVEEWIEALSKPRREAGLIRRKKGTKRRTSVAAGCSCFPHFSSISSGIANVHDNQVAIPLAQLSAQRVTMLYYLMDSAIDAADPRVQPPTRPCAHHCRGSGLVREMEPAHTLSFNERSAWERVNILFKQRYGGRWVRGRGGAKVMCHLMFGLIALTASALFARLI
jgi:hypothetical protein